MRAIIQKVSRAEVKVKGQKISSINQGFLILVAIHRDDQEKNLLKLADKIVKLRIFEDQNNKLNLSIKEQGGEILVVSQFTLYANTNKGNCPSFREAAPSEKAQVLYERLLVELKKRGIKKVLGGQFGAKMEVILVNEGPTTIILDT